MFQFLMNHINRIEYILNTNFTNIRIARIKTKDKKQDARNEKQEKSCLLPLSSYFLFLCNSSIRVIRVHVFVLSVFCLISSVVCLPVLQAEELLKTSKVKVGEKVPLTDSLKKAHEDGKAIILLLLSNPMQCENCEKMSQLIKEEMEKYKDNAAYIVKGGLDIRGATDEETIQLKKLYGFVTIGQPWTFVIDKQGVLRKIFFGMISQNDLADAIQPIIKTGFVNIKEFIFAVTEGEVELNGTKFMVWKYNDSFPGPEIRVKEGDMVRVKLQNKSGGKHGMFFHGIHVPPKVAMQEEVAVDPGYEYIYEFEAKPSGTHLYHCSYNMAEHIDRGLYGSFIVEAKDDEKFDKEFVYIIDDWNSKAARGESHHGAGHPRDMMDYDITTINGKSIKDNPVVMEVKAGERIRIRLANLGSLPHALRLPEGFTLTHEDGYLLPEPKKEGFLTIYSGKRHDIVITAEKKGRLSFYHSINFPKPFGADEKAEHKHDESHASHGKTHLEEKGNLKTNKEEIALIMEVK